MLASLFDGARGLLDWTLSWFNFGTGSENADVGWNPSDPPAPVTDPLTGAGPAPGSEPVMAFAADTPAGHAPASESREPVQAAPTPLGRFEQIDQAQLSDTLARWQTVESAVQSAPADMLMLGAMATAYRDAEESTTMRLGLSFEDSNGLDTADLEALGQSLSATVLFSPLVQPALTLSLNETTTAGLISLDGPANPALAQVYLPLDFSLSDAAGDSSSFSLTLPILNTDLL